MAAGGTTWGVGSFCPPGNDCSDEKKVGLCLGRANSARSFRREQQLHRAVVTAIEANWILRALCQAGAPFVFICIVEAILSDPSLDSSRTIQSLELFAGKREVTKAQLRKGRVAVAFEIDDDEEFGDILSSWGYLHVSPLSLTWYT